MLKKHIKYLYNLVKENIKYRLETLRFIKAFFSPFKRPKLLFYLGRVAVGTPIFYPRKWVRSRQKTGYMEANPKKVGFDFVGLGYKMKWNEFRHEWNPVFSFVFFGYQFAITVRPEEADHYWECWLNFEYRTDKSKSWKERIAESRKIFPCVWTTYGADAPAGGRHICYWDEILKKKYL
jgi:hypothetical protein